MVATALTRFTRRYGITGEILSLLLLLLTSSSAFLNHNNFARTRQPSFFPPKHFIPIAQMSSVTTVEDVSHVPNVLVVECGKTCGNPKHILAIEQRMHHSSNTI